MRRAPLSLLLLALPACSLFGPSGPHYVVFFQERSAQLDPPARAVIAQVARGVASRRVEITVGGH